MSQKTDELINHFAAALREKLSAAEAKYGYSDDWLNGGWRDDLIRKLREHVEKGDPRDVAAYCAFAWHHQWSLATPTPPGPADNREAHRLAWEIVNAWVSKCFNEDVANEHADLADRIAAALRPAAPADNGEAVELLPCPFCGNAPRVISLHEEPDGFTAEWMIRCNTCGFDIGDEYRTEAFASWNTRAALRPAALPGDVERGVCGEIKRIMQTYREQEAERGYVDTPGGLEHMGDVWRLLSEWDDRLRAALARVPSADMVCVPRADMDALCNEAESNFEHGRDAAVGDCPVCQAIIRYRAAGPGDDAKKVK